MIKNATHKINKIADGSPAAKAGIKVGDCLISINGNDVEDIFDYRYLIQDSHLKMVLSAADGKEKNVTIKKGYFDDPGLEFEMPLLDEYKRCQNACVFCFIDQLPKGMRETLYFKDDDSRLSFLQGNYLTLTNLKQKDLDKIIKYHLSPINISVHTMNKELRCKMLKNRFAGDALDKIRQLYEAGISMNAQIVLCPGINDGKELDYSIGELVKYVPRMMSMSVVPVGLTRYREGLPHLRTFTSKEAADTIDLIENWQKKIYDKHHIHFVHASDEFYLLAHRPMPEEERYDGYLQIDNGVGMIRSMTEEVRQSIKDNYYRLQSKGIGKVLLPGLRKGVKPHMPKREVSIATGKAAYFAMKRYGEWMEHFFPWLKVNVYYIENEFFGPKITVTGLLTFADLSKQLKDKSLGDVLLLSENMFRSGEEVFLDDHTRTELEEVLNVKTRIIPTDGNALVCAALGLDDGGWRDDVRHNPYEL